MKKIIFLRKLTSSGFGKFEYSRLVDLKDAFELRKIKVDIVLADLEDNVTLGNGCEIYGKLCSGVKVGDGSSVGEYTTIKKNVRIGSNVNIGNDTVIEKGCVIGPNSTIGDFCLIGKKVTLSDNTKILDMLKVSRN